MTITVNAARNEYTATAGQTLFSYTFKIYEDTDLNVYVTPAGQVADDATDVITAFTVTGEGVAAGGTITLTVPASVGDLVTIVSDIPTDRTTDYQVSGDYVPLTVNNDFDRTVSLVKQVLGEQQRTLQFQQSEQGGVGLTMPTPVAANYIRWKADLSGFENIASTAGTAAEVKTLYESNADTNEFNDAEKTKLGTVDTNAADDQTGAEIKAAYEGEADTNAFTDAEQTLVGTASQAADTNKRDASTGVLTGGVMSTGAGATEFSISDGTGQVVSSTGVITDVSWTGKSNITPTNIAAQNITFISINSSGVVVESSARWTNAQSRAEIIIGVAVHVDRVNVDAVNNEQHYALQATSQLADLYEGLGFFNISGNLFSANGANLNINKSAGVMAAHGANYANDADSPSAIALASLTGLSFQYRYSDGTNGTTGIAFDPNNLDDGAGGLTALSNNKWSVQRVYSFTSNNVKIQRGVESFGTLDKAVAGLSSEAYVTEPSILANGLLRGFIICKKGATDLSNTATTSFLQASKFQDIAVGGAGGVASDMQSTYENSTPNPEILTDDTGGAVTYRRGTTGGDTDDVVEVQNNAGTKTFAVTGAGAITTLSTVDGRDVATDGTKLDTVETSADVTDEANVTTALDGATLTAVTVATGDKVLVQDADDLDNLKTVTAQSIADLGTGGTDAAIRAQVEATANTAGSDNVALGDAAFGSNSSGVRNVGLGDNALAGSLSANGNVGVGSFAGATITTAFGLTAVGEKALQTSNANGTAVGWYAAQSSTVTINAFGYQALRDHTSGVNCAAFGNDSLRVNTIGARNSGFGSGSLRYLVGAYHDNTGLGNDALKYTTAAANLTSYTNCTGVGHDTRVSGDNQVQIGDSATTTYAYGAVQDRSDMRDKADIADTVLGLDFINAVRPVDFRWDYRDDYFDEVTTTENQLMVEAVDAVLDDEGEVIEPARPAVYEDVEVSSLVAVTKDGSRKRNRKHHGVIAQEIQQLIADTGVDFAGFKDAGYDGNGEDVLSIGYTEFVAPLIKAVQELSAKNDTLTALLISKGVIDADEI